MHFYCFKHTPIPTRLVVIYYSGPRTLSQFACSCWSYQECQAGEREERRRGEAKRLCSPTSTHRCHPSLCSSPGMAIHWASTESAVLCTWSLGTTLSTMPTWRASVGGKSNPSCRARSEARCPMVFTRVSLNLECRHPLTWGWGLSPRAKWSEGTVPGLTRRGRRCPAGSHSAQCSTWGCQP